MRTRRALCARAKSRCGIGDALFGVGYWGIAGGARLDTVAMSVDEGARLIEIVGSGPSSLRWCEHFTSGGNVYQSQNMGEGMSVLDITGDDIALLSDTDLRAIVGRLCESEVRRRGLSTSSVTWGGSQTAKDGGLDVRVALAEGAEIGGYIPKRSSGYQVKKPDMGRSAIIKEMKPEGVLRPVLIELAKANGAYVIVSSKGSVSDTALADRRSAMVEAMGEHATSMTLDFFDRGRIASWVREHPGLVPWVRSRIGKSLVGWRSFGDWASTPAGRNPEYILDDSARVACPGDRPGEERSAVDAINRLRTSLRNAGGVVRLVGLSGVGKTRLAEALFETSVGIDALDSGLCIYTDLADTPNPPPIGLASDLIATRSCAILVIDNCPPDVHHQVAKLACAEHSTISLLTIEYDIRDDLPEETEVFRLEPSSLDVIEKLIGRRFPDISNVDAKVIAEFSGGNARIALALAATLKNNESLAGLTNANLFQRLFDQRNSPDASLLRVGQACSLVYSFEGEKLSGGNSELPVLANLAGLTAQQVYQGVAELRRRDLVQVRSHWRAVLPHALANGLAATALENIPYPMLVANLRDCASERLRRSFARRLGYLHDRKEAQKLVAEWLQSEGPLADLANLSAEGEAILGFVAPVVPDAVLLKLEADLETATQPAKPRLLARLLRSLAYDAGSFERSVSLLVKLSATIDPAEKNNIAEIISSLFSIVLSGTHATLDARVATARRLLKSPTSATRSLGIECLNSMLQTSNFSSTYEFEFGARPRDYGFEPKSSVDVEHWFRAVLDIASDFVNSPDHAQGVRQSLAQHFRGLWQFAKLRTQLEELIRGVASTGFWREGWIAVRRALTYDGPQMDPPERKRLEDLLARLGPVGVAQRVRALVLQPAQGSYIDADDIDGDPPESFEAREKRLVETVEKLGRSVACDEEVLDQLLPELLGSGGRLIGFGRGLALGAPDPKALWSKLVTQVAAGQKSYVSVLGGFISGLSDRDRASAGELLDEATTNGSLAAWFPYLQSFGGLDDVALKRLHRVLGLGDVPVAGFDWLGYYSQADELPEEDLANLLLAIAAKPDGAAVVVRILAQRIRLARNRKQVLALRLVRVGHVALNGYSLKKDKHDREDHDLGEVIRGTLIGDEGMPVARRLCNALRLAVANHQVYAFDQDALTSSLLAVQPTVVLDEFFEGDERARTASVELLTRQTRHQKNPMATVSAELLLEWCDHAPTVRYPIAAAVGALFEEADEELSAWRPLARQLLERAPGPLVVFNELVDRLHPMSWSGSLATKLESRLKLLDSLDLSGLANSLAVAFETARANLLKRIESERRREERDQREGSFE